MKTSDFDYYLPRELIAQAPLLRRDISRMMVLLPSEKIVEHSCVSNLPDWLYSGDLIVANNSRVIPARLFGIKKRTGGNVEILIIEGKDKLWESYYHASGRPKKGTIIIFNDNWTGRIEEQLGEGKVLISFEGNGSFQDFLLRNGTMPLPPYIKRSKSENKLGVIDRERYQTIYAKHEGSIAAPTAGLHFSSELIEKLKKKGIEWCEVTLHVGPGTFKPVKTENIEDHKMEAERFEITEDAAEKIHQAILLQKRIIAIGSTTVRVLETLARNEKYFKEKKGQTDLFIRPGYRFQIVDAILTNFHLPRSTLLMMVSAFAGKDFIMKAYQLAIKEKYRFYSYGDCMVILGRKWDKNYFHNVICLNE